jgi:hypothetical protein
MVEYELQEIEAHQGPDVTFEGRLLGEYSARSKSSTRWTDYEVWETRGGAWIVVIIGRTSEESEQDYYSIKVLAPGDEQARILEAMDFMRWGYGPRALAKKLGWNLKVRVE